MPDQWGARRVQKEQHVVVTLEQEQHRLGLRGLQGVDNGVGVRLGAADDAPGSLSRAVPIQAAFHGVGGRCMRLCILKERDPPFHLRAARLHRHLQLVRDALARAAALEHSEHCGSAGERQQLIRHFSLMARARTIDVGFRTLEAIQRIAPSAVAGHETPAGVQHVQDIRVHLHE
jgi:hypothetical protein